jgi:hypothetical protein
VLESVRNQFVQQQAQRGCQFDGDIDRGGLDDQSRLGRVSAAQDLSQAACVLPQVDPLHRFAAIELFVDDRHGANPPDAILQNGANRICAALVTLQSQKAGDDLQVVLDAMMHFLEQNLLLAQ